MTNDAQGPDAQHQVPEGVSEATVEALGSLSAAVEVIEHARGLLYGFHRLTGTADLNLGEAVEQLRKAGHTELAERIDTELVGRNVIDGRWTFQVVEDYDDGYWSRFREWESTVRDRLTDGRRHVYEAQLKEQNRTHGREGHEARPGT